MAQFKLNLQLVRQVITFILTAGNVLLSCIDTIERSFPNG